MVVRLLYFDGCPNWQYTDARLRDLQEEVGFRLERQRVGSPEEAERLRFRGSPTVLVDGIDAFADLAAEPDAPAGLACRVYDTPEGPRGSPTLAQLRAALGAR